jgi:hypothetical protein
VKLLGGLEIVGNSNDEIAAFVWHIRLDLDFVKEDSEHRKMLAEEDLILLVIVSITQKFAELSYFYLSPIFL